MCITHLFYSTEKMRFLLKKGMIILAEYSYVLSQSIDSNGSAIFNDVIPCNRGLIYHRNESGIFVLRGIVNNPTQCFARYQAIYNGNASIPTDGIAGPISIALAVDGEAINSSVAIVTPTTTNSLFNITSTAIIDCPKGCCLNLSLKNLTDQTINLANSNLTITRIA